MKGALSFQTAVRDYFLDQSTILLTLLCLLHSGGRFSEATSPLDMSTHDTASPPRVIDEPTSSSVGMSQPVTSPNQVARRTSSRYTPPLRSLTPQPTEQVPGDKPNDNDLAFRASLASILNSSSSPQRLLATLSQLPQYNGGDSSLSQYQPSSLEYPREDPNDHASDFHVSDYFNSSPPGADPFPNRFIEPSDPNELYYANPNLPLNSTTEDLRKAYQSAQDVETDMDNVQINIESFMESLGMNPSTFDNTTPTMDIFTNGDVEAAVNGDPFVPYDGVANIPAPNDSSNAAKGGVSGALGEEKGPSVDIDSLFDQITTAASDGNSFDTSQYTTQDAQSIAQQAAILPELGKAMQDPPISPTSKMMTTPSTPSETPSSPSTTQTRPPRLKRKSGSGGTSIDGSVRGSNSPERRDPAPPLKKARLKRKKV